MFLIEWQTEEARQEGYRRRRLHRWCQHRADCACRAHLLTQVSRQFLQERIALRHRAADDAERRASSCTCLVATLCCWKADSSFCRCPTCLARATYTITWRPRSATISLSDFRVFRDRMVDVCSQYDSALSLHISDLECHQFRILAVTDIIWPFFVAPGS